MPAQAYALVDLPDTRTPRDPQVLFGMLPKTSTGKLQKFVPRKQMRSASAME